jgi:hypothetical protein
MVATAKAVNASILAQDVKATEGRRKKAEGRRDQFPSALKLKTTLRLMKSSVQRTLPSALVLNLLPSALCLLP